MKQINYLKVKGNNNSMCNKVNKYEKGGSYEKWEIYLFQKWASFFAAGFHHHNLFIIDDLKLISVN